MISHPLILAVFLFLYTEARASVVNSVGIFNNLSSNHHVSLNGSVYSLTRSLMLNDLSNITIHGGSTGSVVSCAAGVGVAIFNVSSLAIHNVTFLHCGAPANETGLLRETSSIAPVNVPSDINVGLIVAESSDLVLSGVTVNGTSGLGMMVMNVRGSVSISDSYFINNRSPHCYLLLQESTLYGHYVGGGITFIYEDAGIDFRNSSVSVTLSNTGFHNNQGCTNNAKVGLYLQYSEELGYVVGEGGLALISSQLEYGLQFNVLACKFTNNIGRFGSALAVTIFEGVNNIGVDVINSTFSKNGFYLETNRHIKDYFFVGGAIGVAVNLIRPQEDFKFLCTESRHILINIAGCLLERNKAFAGGGLMIYSHHYTCTTAKIPVVIIRDSTFNKNTAMLGAAMYIEDIRKHAGIQVNLLGSIEIASSHLEFDDYHNSVKDTSAAVAVISTSLLVAGRVMILDTNGTGLEAQSSFVVIQGTLFIADNQGVYGGGMKLIDFSIVQLLEHSDLTIINNTAMLYGGGIYVDFLNSSPTTINANCFLYFGDIDFFCELEDCVDFETFDAHLEIADNSAKQGEIVYGSTLETCAWANKSQNVFNTLREYFIFDHKKYNSFNTRPRAINVENLTSFHKMPGQKFELTMQAVDNFNHSVPALITLGRLDSAKLGNMGYYFLDGNGSNIVPITTYGEQGQTINLTIYMIDSYRSSVSLIVELQQCAPGFQYNEELQVCECIPGLIEHDIQCFVNNASILVPEGVWIGPLNNFQIENLVVHDCLLNFCQVGSSTLVVNGSFESQCKEGSNRDGLLCGSCAKGYSLALRGFNCIKCTNYSLFLLLYFLVMGVAFIVGLALFDINLSAGFLNGFAFFEHIGHINSYDLVPYIGQPLQPFELLNSNCAIATCFYDGMQELERTITGLLYPIYLLGIIVIIYYAAKKISFISKLGFAITKTFATLLVILYVIVAETCIRIMAFVQVKTLSGVKVLRWRYDPEVEYFTSVHAVMVVVSTVILAIYVIPLPFLLLCPEKLYTMKYTNHLKPFFDALWNPFKPRYRFWLGFRLILRMLLFLFAALLPSSLNIFLTLLSLFLLTMIQVHVKPFQGKWQNFTDILFLSILILLFMMTLFFQTSNRDDDADLTQYVTALAISMTAYTILVPIVMYHLILKYPKLKQPLVKLTAILHKIWPKEEMHVTKDRKLSLSYKSQLSLMRRSQILTPVNPVTPTLETSPASTHILEDIDEEFRSAGLETIVTHTVFREPLLDEGELEIEASYSSRILRAASNSMLSIDK